MSWRMPPEWAAHERCLMAWPSDARWQRHSERARSEYAATANAIATFEPVTVIAAPGHGAEVRARCTSTIDVIELPLDDSWLRDSGPIFVCDERGRRAGVDFRFNAWGGKYAQYASDDALSAALLARLGIERIASDMILEGGAITVDGEGTLITTEQCLLNPNRNPRMSREAIEAELRRTLGVFKVIWLAWGAFEDVGTDGHVDGVCSYVRPGVVLAQTCEDESNPNFERMAANLTILRAARDAKGRPLEVIELPQLPYFDLDGGTVAAGYANFYLANGAVIVPTVDLPLDGGALSIIRRAFPEREVVGVPSRIVAFGGGGTLCITQQLPRAG